MWGSTKFDVFIKYLNTNEIHVAIDGIEHKLFFSKGSDSIWIQHEGFLFKVLSQHQIDYAKIVKKKAKELVGGNFNLVSPLHGKISAVHVSAGQKVEQGTTILTIESMKTENNISCASSGIVEKIWIELSHGVKENQLLVSFIN
jgi:acetyl/propionyl-CoA carboxylase alpha subunit